MPDTRTLAPRTAATESHRLLDESGARLRTAAGGFMRVEQTVAATRLFTESLSRLQTEASSPLVTEQFSHG